jgi:hypothetical protein
MKAIPQGITNQPVERGADWTDVEINLIVADYFAMLGQELAGQQFNKTAHRAALSPRLNGRSNGSIEFKHQNISGVLVDLGLPYITGYKPRGNYQRRLSEIVDQYLISHPNLLTDFSNSRVLDPVAPPTIGTIIPSHAFEDPPERIVAPPLAAEPWRSLRGRKIDFIERDAKNRRLGKLGEQFVVELEKRRLIGAGRDDLAARIEWVADTRGDGIGFDVLSFDEQTDAERLVEVKTTGMGKYAAFYVSSNEVRCSEATADHYHLYRVFNFAELPKVYVLKGSLASACRLEPIQYRASFETV